MRRNVVSVRRSSRPACFFPESESDMK
jgi:hypothetical protein